MSSKAPFVLSWCHFLPGLVVLTRPIAGSFVALLGPPIRGVFLARDMAVNLRRKLQGHPTVRFDFSVLVSSRQTGAILTMNHPLFLFPKKVCLFYFPPADRLIRFSAPQPRFPPFPALFSPVEFFLNGCPNRSFFRLAFVTL